MKNYGHFGKLQNSAIACKTWTTGLQQPTLQSIICVASSLGNCSAMSENSMAFNMSRGPMASVEKSRNLGGTYNEP